MKKIKKYIIYIGVFILTLILGITIPKTKAQEINPLPITEVDYSQMGTISFILQPTSTQAELYFIVPKGATTVYYQGWNDDYYFYETATLSLSSQTVALQTQQFANDIYVSWFGSSEGSILLNYFDMYRYLGGFSSLPFYSSWSSGSYLAQTFSFDGSSSTVIFENSYSYVLNNNVQHIHSFVNVYTQGYNKGYLTNNEDMETTYNYAYAQGVAYATDMFQQEIEEIHNNYQMQLDIKEQEIVQSYNNGYNAGQSSEFNALSWLTSIITFVGTLFFIEFIPGLPIGAVVLIPIALMMLPFLIGLLKGRK